MTVTLSLNRTLGSGPSRAKSAAFFAADFRFFVGFLKGGAAAICAAARHCAQNQSPSGGNSLLRQPVWAVRSQVPFLPSHISSSPPFFPLQTPQGWYATPVNSSTSGSFWFQT